VDVGVLLRWDVYPTDRERFEARLRLAGELGLGGMPIDVVVLNDAPPTLAVRIAWERQRLFCADAEADHAFRRDAQLRAADLAPFLRRMARLKLEAIGGDAPPRTSGCPGSARPDPRLRGAGAGPPQSGQ
jgi:hypothetical protein